MVQTIPLLQEIEVSARVSAVAVHDSGVWAYGQVDGSVITTTSSLKVTGSISSIGYIDESLLIVADDLDGITAFSGDELSWSVEVIDGIEKMHVGNEIIAQTGSGNLLQVSTDGTSNQIAESVQNFSVGKAIAIIDDEQKVHLLSNSGAITWSRPVRGNHGERITAIGWDEDILVVAREGYALVPGEEEAFEIERWKDGVLVDRSESPARVSVAGKFIGLSEGGIVGGIDLQYPIIEIIEVPAGLLVSSWFHLRLCKGNEVVWSVEHKGVVEMIASTLDGSLVIIAGEDQNDITGSEPVLLLDSNSEPIDAIDDSINITPIPEIEYEQLLTEEEQLIIGSNPKVEHDRLMDLLSEELEQLPSESDEVNLMEDLLHDVNETIPPVVDAGQDIFAESDEYGKATVLLDGSSTSDPQERIVSWSWIDSSGKEISSNTQVKVILSRGKHRFDLRIRDDEGRWSSDSVFVVVGD